MLCSYRIYEYMLKSNLQRCVGYSTTSSSPTQAEIVIAGAGVVANSVAYHLTQHGKHDVLVLEQAKIGSGSSHFGSGTLGLLKPIGYRNLIGYSIKLYQEIQRMGYDIELKQCGSISLAQTSDRLIALKRRMAYNLPTGLHCELISKTVLKELHPFLHTDDIEGAVWVPDDAVANPRAICEALALLAQNNGAQYREHTSVKKVLTQNKRVYGVETNGGVIKCEYFVNCAGMWARELGFKCAPPVHIPAYPAEHFYATTGPIPEVLNCDLPVIRDYDAFTYARECQHGFLVGWFEQEAKPAFEDSVVPTNWTAYVHKDFKHFAPLWQRAVHRIPILATCKHTELVNTPDNFTPDGRWILGECPEVKNYFVACGMNGNSLQGAGGIGKAVAEWITEGHATQDLLPFNVQRFLDVHNNKRYLRQRTKEVVGRHYAILYPHQSEYKYARRLRCSPLYSVLEKRGAVFGIRMAYERALYFDSTYKKSDPKPRMPAGSFFKPKFFDFMKEEFQACQQGVGIIDMSSFSKIEIQANGREAVDYLQYLCSNDVDVPIGSIVHTGMQNVRGGYENDCMLVRQTESNYFMVSPTSQQTRIYEWMRRHLPSQGTVHLNDVTSMYTVINVVGPKANALLRQLTNRDLMLPSFTYTKVNLGYASDVMVMSFTHTGEPGYCLYVPSEYALHIYYQLMKVGVDYGARDVGTLTQRFMRIERFIPFWAEELTSFITPFEAGNDYSVRLDKKANFIGKNALIEQKQQGVKKLLVFFHVKSIDVDKDVWPWGGEPIYRNGKFMGTVTSTGYGFAADKLICLGFIRRADRNRAITSEYVMSKDAHYEIDIAGVKFELTAYVRAPPVLNQPATNTQKYRPAVISYISD